MACRNSEAGRVIRPAPASECLSRQNDHSKLPAVPPIVHSLARRLGVSIEVAGVVAELAALGPREARP